VDFVACEIGNIVRCVPEIMYGFPALPLRGWRVNSVGR